MRVGEGVGRYVVLGELGRGGMGVVLHAYDPKLQREVALKEVRRELLGDVGSDRLVLEARAMAKLSHPHVVAVYDVEELEGGRLVLAMEYVPGTTLKEWLRQEPRAWPEVLRRFVAAGRGLAAAHGAGLLHRDFKPANVLVGEADVVKVTDFGLAKAEAAAAGGASDSLDTGSDSGSLTQPGLVLGTPRYMAPEQHRGESLTAAADQYGFCVALWEALCGEAPFHGKRLGAQKSNGPPPWPATTGQGTSGLPRAIPAAIVRGLAAHPGERWPSMDALREVLAHDPRRRRARWLVVAAGVAAAALGAMVVLSWVTTRAEWCAEADARAKLAGGWDGARRAEVEAALLGIDAAYAEAVWKRTAAELDRYAEAWAAMHVEACEATTIRGEQSTNALDLRMACLHRAHTHLAAVTVVLAQADASVMQRAHELVAGLRPLERCADIEALQADVEPPLPHDADAVEEARVLLAEATAERAAGRFADAQRKTEAAKQRLEGVEYGPMQTDVLLAEGEVLADLGEYAASEAKLREALREASHLRQPEALRNAASLLIFIVGSQLRRPAEGLQYRELAEGLIPDDPQAEAYVLQSIGLVLEEAGRFEEAVTTQRRALALREEAHGPEHPDVAISRAALANALMDAGELEEAVEEHRQALALRVKILGPDHPHTAASRSVLGSGLQRLGRYEEAEAQQRRAVEILEAALGPEHPDTIAVRVNLAGALGSQERYDAAEVELRRAVAGFEKVLGPDHPHVATTRSMLATALHGQGKDVEAEAEHRKALAAFEKLLEPDNPTIATVRHNLANALHAQGKLEEAEAQFRATLGAREKVLGPDHPRVALTQHGLGELLLDRGQAEEALVLAEASWKRNQRDDIPAEVSAGSAFLLARALWAKGTNADDRRRALELANKAREAFAGAGEVATERAENVEAWLNDHRE
jgi:serine/threonine-protein kinase